MFRRTRPGSKQAADAQRSKLTPKRCPDLAGGETGLHLPVHKVVEASEGSTRLLENLEKAAQAVFFPRGAIHEAEQ